MNSDLKIYEKDARQVVRLTVNGDTHELLVSANETLLSALRNHLQLTGTKYGCGTGDCCACTVLIDNNAVLSCLSLAADLDGSEVTTIEGLGDPDKLDPIQESFVEKGAVQCGFCTPGMIMTVKSLLDEDPEPSETKIRHYLRGNLCRCTGYSKIIDASLDASKKIARGV